MLLHLAAALLSWAAAARCAPAASSLPPPASRRVGQPVTVVHNPCCRADGNGPVGVDVGPVTFQPVSVLDTHEVGASVMSCLQPGLVSARTSRFLQERAGQAACALILPCKEAPGLSCMRPLQRYCTKGCPMPRRAQKVAPNQLLLFVCALRPADHSQVVVGARCAGRCCRPGSEKHARQLRVLLQGRCRPSSRDGSASARSATPAPAAPCLPHACPAACPAACLMPAPAPCLQVLGDHRGDCPVPHRGRLLHLARLQAVEAGKEEGGGV